MKETISIDALHSLVDEDGTPTQSLLSTPFVEEGAYFGDLEPSSY